MGKTVRAAIVYRYTDKNNMETRIMKLTMLAYEKNPEIIREKLTSLNKEHLNIEILKIQWKNWWGA